MSGVFIKTFGCQMNVYDSDRVYQLLEEREGLLPVDTPAEADVLLLNTCSIREKAQEKLFHQLGRWRSLKEKNPELIIGVGGCVATQEGRNIFDRAPYTDLVFGPQTLHRLPEMIERVRVKRRGGIKGRGEIDISFPEIEKFDHLPRLVRTSHTAMVSIMEGCSKYCSFCVVPYTRGEEVSRPLEDIVREVNELVHKGVREVNLLGQNVNAFQSQIDDLVTADLTFLLEVLAEIKELKRIRFTTSHPAEFTPRMIRAYRDIPKLAAHLHLPVQSGSNRILQMMKRGYTREHYLEIIVALREARANISLSSDFIVGFPGESEADFAETLSLVEAVGFDKSFSFLYSKRPGTPAADLEDLTPIFEKQAWLYTLQDKLKAQSLAISEDMIGRVEHCLVMKNLSNGKAYAQTENMRNVEFGQSNERIGEIVSLQIIGREHNTLLGEVVNHSKVSAGLNA